MIALQAYIHLLFRENFYLLFEYQTIILIKLYKLTFPLLFAISNVFECAVFFI
jgi:hypothetical protein